MTQSKDANTEDATATPRMQGLHWRFDFGAYAQTRHFLDQLAQLSIRENYYPNVSFGKTYVNVSIDAEGRTTLGEREAAFIQDMNKFAENNQT